MKFVKISNKGTVHRKYLEIIGAGTKQHRLEDPSVVGQFHSGFKMAIVAAMRIGLKVIVSSVDEISPYILSFEAKPVSFTHQKKKITLHLVCYKYSDGTHLVTNIALTAFPQWTSIIGSDNSRVYPILREFIANAKDSDSDWKLEKKVEVLIQAEAGHTVVYIEENRDVRRVLDGYPKQYFKFLKDGPIFEVPDVGAIYPKASSFASRFFNYGYLVGCKSDRWLVNKALYDYDAYGKDFVSEERIISNQYQFDKQIAELFTRITDKALLRSIIDFTHTDSSCYETDILYYIYTMPRNFKSLCYEIWKEKFGKDAVLRGRNNDININAESLGYSVVNVGYKLYSFLRRVGVKNTEEAMADREKEIQRREPTQDEKNRLERIKALYLQGMKHYAEIIDRCPVGVCIDPDKFWRGMAIDNEIFIEEDVFKENTTEFLITYLHELRHHRTGLKDTEFRKFMWEADRELAIMTQLLAIALFKLRELGVDPSELSEYFTSTKKSQ